MNKKVKSILYQLLIMLVAFNNLPVCHTVMSELIQSWLAMQQVLPVNRRNKYSFTFAASSKINQ